MSILEKIPKPVALITVMENIMPRYNLEERPFTHSLYEVI
jgi:hypothetical protein